MAEKVQDKKIQKAPAGKGGQGSGQGPAPHKPGDKNPRPESSQKKGSDNKKKW